MEAAPVVRFYPRRTQRLVLRRARREDAGALAALLNDRTIARGIPRIRHPYTRKDALKWVRSVSKVRHNETFGWGRDWVVEMDGRIVGACHLSYNPEHARGFFGYWVGKPFRRRGIATEVARALVDLCFSELGAKRVWAMAFADNTASRHVLERAGLKQEALLRKNALIGGRWRDDACYGILRREWDAAVVVVGKKRRQAR
jgi:RimJ/RimL family protein N-acetyltransferase